jgi:hypothetical protein
MDYNKMQNDKITSSLINVEVLQKEYEVILKQYEEAVKNYIATLEDRKSNKKFTSFKGRTWWGTGSVNEGAATTKEECETMCANTNKCSGATFNPVKRYCWARTGDDSLTAGETDDYALIPKQKASLIVMQSLNDKLLSINEQISNELKNINPEVKKQIKKNINKQKKIEKSYQSLLEQKKEMAKQIQEYNSLEQENNNQSLFANQKTLSFRFWVLITAIILLITIRRMYGSDTLPLSIIIWLIVLIVMIILTYTLTSPAGFFMWFILIMVIILMKSGNLPSL